MTTARPALDVLRAGPVAAGATLWRSRGQLHVTLVAKATFAMVPGGEARRIEPLEIVRSEVYTRGNPMKPLLAASELAPWLGRAEVVLTGHAWAPGGAPLRRMAVRLALLRAGAALVDKSLEVVGDRAGGAAAVALPEPFVKMPIEYQRAYGGPGEPENPLGVGAGEGGGALPNLLPPGGGRAPAGLGPIPPIVPSRTRLLRGLARAELEGIASIPDDFDWSYFQSAPADQRFDRVLGGEEIVLEGLSQHHPTLATRLPALRALATILLPNGAARWLPLVGDTLIVQPDAERCAVVFRGSFQVASEEVLPALRAAVGVEVGDEPVPWPDLSEAPAGAPSAAGAAAGESAKRTDWSSTVRLGEDDVVDAPVSVAGGAVRREPVRDGAHPLEGTFPLDDTLPPAGGGARPREARTVPLPPVRVRGPGQDDAVSAPFPIAPAGARGEREGGERPSAPWAAGGAAAVPAIASPLEGTIELSEPEAAPAQTAPSPAQDVTPAPTPVEIATPAPAPTLAAASASAPTQAAAPAPAPTQAAAPAPVATPAPARASEPLPAPARDPEVERSPEPRAPAPAPSAPKREQPTLLGSLYKRFRKD
ncbi:DUF2169 family type VI secretion system accessory protein [Sorangium sp. So ce124]|uniref:DUF2169 family type VI secretion system accessory protein n=1 Tax=Sorangium sp. So ce124 TaxID=3133280 RepID=UPI003F5EBB1E